MSKPLEGKKPAASRGARRSILRKRLTVPPTVRSTPRLGVPVNDALRPTGRAQAGHQRSHAQQLAPAWAPIPRSLSRVAC